MRISASEVDLLLQQGGWATLRFRVGGYSLCTRTYEYRDVLPDPQLAYGYTPITLQQMPPSMGEIELMDEANGWLSYVPDNLTRKVVAMRMLWNGDIGRCVHSYRRVGISLGLSEYRVKRFHQDGLQAIARQVNKNSALVSKLGLYLAQMEAPYSK